MLSAGLAALFLAAAAWNGDGPGTAADPETTYWVYVGAESADYLHRIRFGPAGAELEASIPVSHLYRQSGVADLFTDSEAPHGVAVSPDGAYVYMTTGHGVPDGKLWKVEAGTGRLLADPVDLGRFPASLGVSPDGLYVFVANFNLHGAMAPSSVSVVYAPDMMEVGRIETCTMPHGGRVHPSGRFHYSVCMMDDQLVEIDLRTLEVARRFGLAQGKEGPLDPGDRGPHARDAHAATHGDAAHSADRVPPPPHAHRYEASCSPTWVKPSGDGERIYVACNRSDEVLEIGFEDWTVLRRFPTGRGPYNLELTGDDRLLVVTLKQGDAVEFIDLEAGETVARGAASTRVVHGVAVSPDDRYAFVSVEGIGGEPGKVDVFDLETFDRVAAVAVGLQASGIAVWKMEGR